MTVAGSTTSIGRVVADVGSGGFTLHGRVDDLARVTGALRRTVATQTASMVLLAADPGLGRSALIGAVAELAGRRRYGVGRAAVADSRRGPAHQDHRVAVLAPPMGALLTALRAGPDPLLPHDEFVRLAALHDRPLWLVDRLASILEQRAAAGPVLVALDDLQWADPGTVFALEVLPERLADSPVVWVLSTRANEGPASEVAVAAARAVTVTEIELAPLAREDVHRLARDRLGHDPAPGLSTLLAGAGGNPGLLVRLLDDVAADVRRSGPAAPAASGVELPAGFVAFHRARLEAQHPASTVALLQAAAVLRTFALEDAAAVLDTPPRALVPALGRGVHAGLLLDDGDRISFRNELVRRVVYDGVPASTRRLLHSVAAQHLIDRGRSPVEVAPHVVATAARGETRAVGILRAAAAEVAPADPAGAVTLLETAFGVLTDDDGAGRCDVGCELVAALGAARRHRDAAQLADDLPRAGTDDETRGRLVVAGGASWWALGRFHELRVLVDEASATDVTEGTRVRLAALGARLGARPGAWSDAGSGSGSDAASSSGAIARNCVRAADDALRAAVRLEDPVAQGLAYRALGDLALAQGRYRAGLGHFRGLGRLTRTIAVEEIAALVHLDQLQLADARLTEAVAQARPDDARRLTELAVVRAQLHLVRGELDAAAADAADALRAGTHEDEPAQSDAARAVLGQVALARGDLGATRHELDATVDEGGGGDPGTQLVLGLLAAAVQLGERRPAAASKLLRGLVLPGGAASLGGTTEHLVPAVRIAIEVRDDALARELAAVVVEHAARIPDVARVGALADQALGLLDADVALLSRAVQGLRGSPRSLLRAAAAEDLGVALLAQGRGAAGVAELDRAWDTFARLGAVGAARRVQRRLRSAGVRRHRWTVEPARPAGGWDSLTDAEKRVAELIAAGSSNREAAAALFVSPNTVATHLRAVYRKLDVNSRVQLARRTLLGP